VIVWRSLETRLTAWYSLVLFLGYAIFGVGLWLAVRVSVSSAVDDLLTDQLERLVAVVESDADGPGEVEEELVEYVMALPESRFTQVRDSTGSLVYPDQTALSAGAVVAGFSNAQWEEVPYRVLTRDITVLGQSFEVRLASSLQSLVLVRERLAASLLAAAPLALVLCSGGGFFIARRALSHLDRMAATAAGITVGNLSSRIDVPATGDALERLALTINEMLERLETSVRRIERFSADASHELRTPLTVIRTTAELALRHGRTEAEYRGDLEDIHAQALRLSELVEVLLTLSREGGEGRPVAMSHVDLLGLAGEICRQFRREAESKDLRLELDGPEHPVWVLGNDPSLRRMIASLLENALAHTHEGGITVTVREDGAPEIAVADTGEGIPEEAIGKIFDRFYRVDSSRSRATGGQGLGLSIALRIATLHGAELTAKSRLGEGARLTVRFPRKGEVGIQHPGLGSSDDPRRSR
jgi:signal transduction histidine kinase